MSHLKAKIKRPVFQDNSTKWGQRFVLCVSSICVFSYFSSWKTKSNQFQDNAEKFQYENVKMRAPVPLLNLFKKSSMILYLFLKTKSQAKAWIIKTEEKRKENC